MGNITLSQAIPLLARFFSEGGTGSAGRIQRIEAFLREEEQLLVVTVTFWVHLFREFQANEPAFLYSFVASFFH